MFVDSSGSDQMKQFHLSVESACNFPSHSARFQLWYHTAVLRCFDSSVRFLLSVHLLRAHFSVFVRQSPRLRVRCSSQLVCFESRGRMRQIPWAQRETGSSNSDSLVLCMGAQSSKETCRDCLFSSVSVLSLLSVFVCCTFICMHRDLVVAFSRLIQKRSHSTSHP